MDTRLPLMGKGRFVSISGSASSGFEGQSHERPSEKNNDLTIRFSL